MKDDLQAMSFTEIEHEMNRLGSRMFMRDDGLGMIFAPKAVEGPSVLFAQDGGDSKVDIAECRHIMDVVFPDREYTRFIPSGKDDNIVHYILSVGTRTD